MAIRRGQSQIEHDQVILASAATYDSFRRRGFYVSVNLTGKQCHNVGGGNFPDLVVWRTGGDYGRTAIIEEVETSETVNELEAKEWERYTHFGASFFLIVPKDFMDRAEEIVSRMNIKVDAIEGYYFDYHGEVKFVTQQPHKK